MTSSPRSLLFVSALSLAFGFAGAALWSVTGLGNGATHDYLVDNPEILPEMANVLQQREAARRLANVRGDVYSPFPGAVLGNPAGKHVLIEFTDYGCTFCRHSVGDVKAMIAADPDLKVVIREWPIFEGSDVPARWALAAARQGKFAAFHDAMFAAGSTSPEAVQAAAKQAGLDMAAAQQFVGGREAEFELMKNRSLAQQLGFEGTPSWVAGEQLLFGAIGQDTLTKALASADKS
ncbi:MAG: DsbA family protein [Sphingomonadales bacterium]|nr:DsbA family protein [Sphingomonadales bacterium]MBD3774289.1 DsbA family protein [Paracoccaceae bacterium]